MTDDRIRARYLVETPLDPAAVAEVMAGEQSSGTFVRVGGETDALRARSRRASVSPSTRTKVPLDCSPAITSATAAGSSGVSTR